MIRNAARTVALALLPLLLLTGSAGRALAQDPDERRLGIGAPISHVPNPGYGFDADSQRVGALEGDRFGAAVAIVAPQAPVSLPTFTTLATSNEAIYAVGAPGADSTVAPLGAPPPATGIRAGAVFFVTEGKALLARVGNPNPIDGDDRFGACVVASGSFVFVGCPGGRQGVAGPRGGMVYVIQADVSQGQSFGTIITTIANPSPQDGDQFGASIAVLDDGTVLVGAPGRTTGQGSQVGSVFALFAGGVAGFAFEILNPFPLAGDEFGASVAASTFEGERVIYAGAPGAEDPSTGARSGIVHILAGDPAFVSFGSLIGVITPDAVDDGTNHTPLLAEGGRLGAALAALPDLFVAGAPAEDLDDGQLREDAGFYYVGQPSEGLSLEAFTSPSELPDGAPAEILDGARTGASLAMVLSQPLFGPPAARLLVGVPDRTIATVTTGTGDPIIGFFPRAGAVVLASLDPFNGLQETLFLNPQPDDLDNPAPGGNELAAGDRFGASVAIAGTGGPVNPPPQELTLAASTQFGPDTTSFRIAIGAPLDDDFGSLGFGIPPVRDAGSVFIVARATPNTAPVPTFECGNVQLSTSGGQFLVPSFSGTDPDGDEPFLWRVDAFDPFAPADPLGNVFSRVGDAEASFTWGGAIFGHNPFSYVVTDRNGNYGRSYGCVDVVKQALQPSPFVTVIPSTQSTLVIQATSVASDPDGRTLQYTFVAQTGGSATGAIGFSADTTALFERDPFLDATGGFSADCTVKVRYRQGALFDNSPSAPSLFIADTSVFADSQIHILVNTPPVSGDRSVTIFEADSTTFDVAPLTQDPDQSLAPPFDGVNQTLAYGVLQALPFAADTTLFGSSLQVTAPLDVPAFAQDTTVFYQANDGIESGSTGRIFVRFLPLNDAPFAQDTTIFTDEDTARFYADTTLFAAITDEEGGTMTVTGASLLSGAGATDRSGGSGTTYTPGQDFEGRAVLELSFSDTTVFQEVNGPQGSFQRVTVIVRPLNDAPSYAPGLESVTLTVLEDSSAFLADTSVLRDVLDVDDPLFDLSIGGSTGSLPASVTRVSTGTEFRPAQDAFGERHFEVVVTDRNSGGRAPASPGALSTVKRVTLQVLPVNDAPVCADLAFTIFQNEVVSADVTGDIPESGGTPIVTDVDSTQFFLLRIAGQGVSLTSAGQAKTPHGTVSFTEGGATFTYTPDPFFVGDDVFDYTVADGLVSVQPTAAVPDLAPREDTGRVTITVLTLDAPERLAVRGSGRVLGCATGPAGAMSLAHILGAAMALLAVRARRRRG